MPATPRFLLLQMRNAGDPMREHEICCFAESLGSHADQLATVDLISVDISDHQLHHCDVVLIGGAGDYSVATGGPWLERAMDLMRRLCDLSKPTFASCWGFQAMARALGGEVIHDRDRAEVGTLELTLTDAGRLDPVFGPLGDRFYAQLGHEDRVVTLPANAELLATGERTRHQAYRITGKPIYATQFHPEMSRENLAARLRRYPKYVEAVARMSFEELLESTRDTPETSALLPRFLRAVLGD
jgi:GMP synthase (glutamine-hydrolysing)